MLKTLATIYFFLTGVTAFMYSHDYLFRDGVYLHGMVGVIGFVYTAYLSFQVTEKNYGAFHNTLDRVLSVISALMVISFFLKIKLLSAVCGAGFLFVSIALLARLNRDKNNLRWYFLAASTVIAFLCWVFFIYSLYFDMFFGIATKFRWNMLSFSFTMSLMILSYVVKDISMANLSFRIVMYLVVGGVLTMFFGMLLSHGTLEFVSAAVLLGVIVFLLYTSFIKKHRYIALTFLGLLITGVLGFWFINIVMKTGEGNNLVLNIHSHFAFFGWTTMGMYYILYKLELIDSRKMFINAGLLVVSLLLLILYFAYGGIYFLAPSFVLFTLTGLMRFIRF